MTGQPTIKPVQHRPKRIWIILLIAIIVAWLIWQYFDFRIEQLKSGSPPQSGMLIIIKHLIA
jgi:1-acyl-sn-glycerol-3-phosphate acyltransferase